MNTMKMSTKINLLVLFVLSIAVVLFVSLQLHSAEREQQYKQAHAELSDTLESVKKIEISFKTQVQEWKNILLRGHGSEDLEKYQAQFFELDGSINATVASLIASVENVEKKSELKKFQSEHQQLGEEYRVALALFENGNFKNPYAADDAVRGKDRIPSETLRILSVGLLKDHATLLEQQSHDRKAENNSILIAIAGLFCTLLLFSHWLTNYRITTPLANTLTSVKRLATGDAETPVTGTERKDEIGDLANAVEYFRQNTLANQRMTKEQEEHFLERESVQEKLAIAEAERRVASERGAKLQAEAAEKEIQQAKNVATRINALLRAVDAAAEGDLYYPIERPDINDTSDDLSRMAESLIRLFEELQRNFTEIDSNATSLTQSSSGLETLGLLIMEGATQNSNQTSKASVAADVVTELVGSVAVATEEMSTSIRGIAISADSAAQVAERAVSLVQSTDASVRQLAESSADIGAVIKVITSIAEQTNLLALNATIEAARAGDAGKGFAVVANEVKELAKETASATEEIEKRIASIQSDTHQAVKAIGDINEIVREISETQTTIAAAVEEQNATTNEINRTVEKTVTENSAISQIIDAVAGTAAENRESATGIQSSATELSSMAIKLQASVSRFVKAA